MFWAGLLSIVIGIFLTIVGWVLNTNTPIQQPLPVIGIVIIVIGVGLSLWFH
jgi:hypothetical protein